MRPSGGFAHTLSGDVFADVNTKAVDVQDLETPDLPDSPDNISYPMEGLGDANARAIIGMGYNGVQSFGTDTWEDEADLDNRLRRYAHYTKKYMEWINTTLPQAMRRQIAEAVPHSGNKAALDYPDFVDRLNRLLISRASGKTWFHDNTVEMRNRLKNATDDFKDRFIPAIEKYASTFPIPKLGDMPAPAYAEVMKYAGKLPRFDFVTPAGQTTVTREVVKPLIPWWGMALGAVALIGVAFWAGSSGKSK